MVIIGLVAMYSLLNAGNPDSLLRPIFPDPKYDLYIAMGTSILVFILGFFVFFSRDQESFRQLVQLNGEKIRTLRNEGKNDEQIHLKLNPFLMPLGIDMNWICCRN